MYAKEEDTNKSPNNNGKVTGSHTPREPARDSVANAEPDLSTEICRTDDELTGVLRPSIHMRQRAADVQISHALYSSVLAQEEIYTIPAMRAPITTHALEGNIDTQFKLEAS